MGKFKGYILNKALKGVNKADRWANDGSDTPTQIIAKKLKQKVDQASDWANSKSEPKPQAQPQAQPQKAEAPKPKPRPKVRSRKARTVKPKQSRFIQAFKKGLKQGLKGRRKSTHSAVRPVKLGRTHKHKQVRLKNTGKRIKS